MTGCCSPSLSIPDVSCASLRPHSVFLILTRVSALLLVRSGLSDLESVRTSELARLEGSGKNASFKVAAIDHDTVTENLPADRTESIINALLQFGMESLRREDLVSLVTFDWSRISGQVTGVPHSRRTTSEDIAVTLDLDNETNAHLRKRVRRIADILTTAGHISGSTVAWTGTSSSERRALGQIGTLFSMYKVRARTLDPMMITGHSHRHDLSGHGAIFALASARGGTFTAGLTASRSCSCIARVSGDEYHDAPRVQVECWWFEPFEMVRKLIFSSLLVFVEYGSSRQARPCTLSLLRMSLDLALSSYAQFGIGP